MSKTNTMPSLEKLPPRDFKVVTNTKNRLLKDLKLDQDDENLLAYIRTHVADALCEYTSILFEQAGLDERIQSSGDFLVVV